MKFALINERKEYIDYSLYMDSPTIPIRIELSRFDNSFENETYSPRLVLRQSQYCALLQYSFPQYQIQRASGRLKGAKDQCGILRVCVRGAKRLDRRERVKEY